MKTYGAGVVASKITGVSLKKRFTIGNATAWLRLRTVCAARLLPLLLLLALPAAVQALDYAYTTNNDTITITGYTGPGGAVTIPNMINGLPVTGIGEYAFYSCAKLNGVTIPNNVTNIGAGAFASCFNLTAITVDEFNAVYSSVEGVLFNKTQTALIECPEGRVGSYTIPNSATIVGDYAFYSRTRLTSVTVPASVTNLGSFAFRYCTSLAAVTVDALNSVYSSVDGVLFNKTQTTLIEYPAGKAGSYTISNSVTSIRGQAFEACTRLTSVTIGNSVTSIGDNAFRYCTSLTSVTIPDRVTSIGIYAFAWCTNMSSVTIGKSVISIGAGAFSVCNGLNSVTIPDSVTSIGNYAFRACTRLTSVTIGDSVTSIGWDAFLYCTNLTNVTIGKSVTSIGDNAFWSCINLTSITIPNSVTSIGAFVFSDCYSLKGVYFQGNPPSVGYRVFYSDQNAIEATVYYLAGTTGWGPTFAGLPTVLWNPQVQTSAVSFGMRTNRFGFTITGSSGLAIVVEACTDLANPTWFPLQTITLGGGSSYFSDPQWTNYPARFYRLRSP